MCSGHSNNACVHCSSQKPLFIFLTSVLRFQRIMSFDKALPLYQSKKEGKYQKSIQSSSTPDPGYQWESDNFTIRHHKRQPRGQPFPSRWPQGINKQTRTKALQKQDWNNINDWQKKHCLGTVSKNILLYALNYFHFAWCLECIWHCSGPFELHSYSISPFNDINCYNYMLIVCILQSLKFIHD